MKIETYEVPEIDPETIQLVNNTILGVNEIIEHDGGLIGDQILAKALSIRVRNSAACITRLSNLGFIHESHILLRSVAEATILFHAALNNLGFKDVFTFEESERVYQLLRKQKLVDDGKNPSETKALDEKIRIAKDKYRAVKDKTYEIGDLAVKNSCKFIYVYFYSLGHGYVHCLPNTISDYVTIKSKTSIEFNHTPNMEEREMVVAAGLQCYARMGKKWAKFRNVDSLIEKSEVIFTNLRSRFGNNILREE